MKRDQLIFVDTNADIIFKNQTYSMELSDIDWLTDTIFNLKPITRRRASKSELIRAGINLLKNKTPKEIKYLLDQL